MLLNVLLCALLAALLLAGLWLLCARFLLPVRAKDVFMVLAAQGSGETLEQQCRAWLLLKNAGILQRPLLIADLGLDTEGRCLAQVLLQLDEEITLCRAEDLPALLKTGE